MFGADYRDHDLVFWQAHATRGLKVVQVARH